MDCTALGCLKTVVSAFASQWTSHHHHPVARPQIKYSPLITTYALRARGPLKPILTQPTSAQINIKQLVESSLPANNASPRTFKKSSLTRRKKPRSKNLKVHFAEQAPEQKYVVACFPQPIVDEVYLQNLHNQKVSLEKVAISDFTILGTVRVANIAYEKIVKVRFTANHWKNHYDISACYVQGSCDGGTDRFAFGITPPRFFTIGDQIELAIYYEVSGQTYWDNNGTNNYMFECITKTPRPTAKDTLWTHFL